MITAQELIDRCNMEKFEFIEWYNKRLTIEKLNVVTKSST